MNNKEVFEDIVEDIETARSHNRLDELVLLSTYSGQLGMLAEIADGDLENKIRTFLGSLDREIGRKWNDVEDKMI
jgi:hypothetical protein